MLLLLLLLLLLPPCVQAEGWEHRVTPVKRGSRLILKMAFTSTRIKLPAFDANLHREAYAAY
jgi:hypothetical protein